jgi:nitrogen fixation protein NifQ
MAATDTRNATAADATPMLADADVRGAVARFSAGGGPPERFAEQVAERRAEYDGLVGLLLVHSTPGVDPREAEVVARALAAGCLGEQHLWRDLELPSRAVLRRLFEAYFGPLAADNIMDMRWKKFVYRKLCRWGGFNTCKAPSCRACSSYAECFGPEV